MEETAETEGLTACPGGTGDRRRETRPTNRAWGWTVAVFVYLDSGRNDLEEISLECE